MSIEYSEDEQLGNFTTWRVQPHAYIFGYGQSGQTLVGPHELGAQTLTPPGYIIRERESNPESYSIKGWRHGIWGAGPGEISLGGVALGQVWINGRERPAILNK